MTSRLRFLRSELERIDAELAAHRGEPTVYQDWLLRQRRETVLQINDEEKG